MKGNQRSSFNCLCTTSTFLAEGLSSVYMGGAYVVEQLPFEVAENVPFSTFSLRINANHTMQSQEDIITSCEKEVGIVLFNS